MNSQHDFSADVQSVIGQLLGDLGFTLDEVDDTPDEGGRPQQVVYYRSNDCKIQIYTSWREGEVNCMIAPRSAANKFGPRTERWHVISRFAEPTKLSLAEAIDQANAEQAAYPNQLEWVRDRIAKYYEAAHRGVLAMYDEGYSPRTLLPGSNE